LTAGWQQSMKYNWPKQLMKALLMAVDIPSDFDFRVINLDPQETFVRDVLEVDISKWAEFRHSIMIGNKAEYLHPAPGPITGDVRSAYRELAKSHYEVVKSLGFIRLTLNIALHVQSAPWYLFNFEKIKLDFYFHAGRMLDNLARLIYIIIDPEAAYKTNRRGHYIRHWIDWSDFKKRRYPGYTRITRSEQIRGIVNIRNVLVHGWSIPTKVEGVIHFWPKAIR
jgi:hypothetical protein